MEGGTELIHASLVLPQHFCSGQPGPSLCSEHLLAKLQQIHSTGWKVNLLVLVFHADFDLKLSLLGRDMIPSCVQYPANQFMKQNCSRLPSELLIHPPDRQKQCMAMGDSGGNEDSNRGMQEGEGGEFGKQKCCDKDNLSYPAKGHNDSKPLLTSLQLCKSTNEQHKGTPKVPTDKL